LEEAIQWVIHW